jgi:hypothetical protein
MARPHCRPVAVAVALISEFVLDETAASADLRSAFGAHATKHGSLRTSGPTGDRVGRRAVGAPTPPGFGTSHGMRGGADRDRRRRSRRAGGRHDRRGRRRRAGHASGQGAQRRAVHRPGARHALSDRAGRTRPSDVDRPVPDLRERRVCNLVLRSTTLPHGPLRGRGTGCRITSGRCAGDIACPRARRRERADAVAAGFALTQFIHGTSVVGRSPGPQNAAAMAGDLADLRSGGLSPILRTRPNGNQTSTLRTFNSLANMLVPCVRSQAACARLFKLAPTSSFSGL